MKRAIPPMLLISFCLSVRLTAGETGGTSGGLSLIADGSARASSLAQAYTAAFDDASGMLYNPASLGTLNQGQTSLMYQQGDTENAFGRFILGTPHKNGGVGLTLGYYNAGTINLVDDNGNESPVNARTDLALTVGMARSFGPLLLGLNLKGFSSKLIDRASAKAFAADLGMQVPLGSRLRFGVAALNYGTQLKYGQEGDNLPREIRSGLSYLLSQNRVHTTLLVDAPYMVNERILTPGVGLEMIFGPLAVRGGYKAGPQNRELSMGAGFVFGRASLDYAFGLLNQYSAVHKVSMGMKFGGESKAATAVQFVKKAEPKELKNSSPVREVQAITSKPILTLLQADSKGWETTTPRRVYIIERGDTWASISRKMYGSPMLWKKIALANRHLFQEGDILKIGTKIVIPVDNTTR